MSAPERIGTYEVHPAAQLFPLMTEQELQDFANDLQTNKQRDPIVLLDGRILDGRNRLLACQRVGLPPVFEVAPPEIAASPVAYVVSKNIKRRHLTTEQRDFLGARLVPLLEEEARHRQAEGRSKGGLTTGAIRSGAPGRQSAAAPERAPKTAELAARAVGASTRGVERAKFLLDEAPDLAAKAEAGEVPLRRAEEEVRQRRAPWKAMNVQRQGVAKDEADDRFTPRSFIKKLHAEHDFTVDVASHPASPAAQIIGRFWTKREDGLARSWNGQRVWCNPPFSAIEKWVEKAHRSVVRGKCQLVVMLLPATRTDRRWWHARIEPWRDGRGAGGVGTVETRFLEGRLQFGSPAEPEGLTRKKVIVDGEEKTIDGGTVFGCVLVIWRARAAAPARPADIPFAGLLDEDLPEDHDKLIWRRLRKYRATAHAFAGVGISLCNDYGVEDLIPARAEDVRCQECERIAKSSELEDLVEPRCRECGCSDHNACVPPCSWVVEPADGKPGLCSRCAAKAAGSPLAPKKGWMFTWRRKGKTGEAHAYGAPPDPERSRCGRPGDKRPNVVTSRRAKGGFCASCRRGVDADVRDHGAVDSPLLASSLEEPKEEAPAGDADPVAPRHNPYGTTGPLCGALPPPSFLPKDTCLREAGHEGVHGNGARTWSGKAGPAAPDVVWQIGRAHGAVAHAFRGPNARRTVCDVAITGRHPAAKGDKRCMGCVKRLNKTDSAAKAPKKARKR